MVKINHAFASEGMLCDMPLFNDLSGIPLEDENIVMDVWDFSPPSSPASSCSPLDGMLTVDTLAPQKSFLPSTHIKQSGISFGNHTPFAQHPSSELSSVMWGLSSEDGGLWLTPSTSPESAVEFSEPCFEDFAPFDVVDTSDEEFVSLLDEPVPPVVVTKRRATDDLAPSRRREKKVARITKRQESSTDIAEVIAACKANGADEYETKRMTHNILERKRRNDLKSCYAELRQQIPDLKDDERAATGQVLLRACEFIGTLKDTEQKMLARISAARAENERLRKVLLAAQ